MPIWPARPPGTTRQKCTMVTTPSTVKKFSSFPIPLWDCGRPPDFLQSLTGPAHSTRLSAKKAAHNCPCWRHVAENPDPLDFLQSLTGPAHSTRLSAKKAAHNCPCWRHVAENPDPGTSLRPFRYVAPLYAVAGAKFRIEQRVWLQHFHFWCLQSNGFRRGSRKAASSRPCSVEVKMH